MPSGVIDEGSKVLGEHEARLDNIEGSLKDIREDMKKVLAYMDGAKGSWRMLVGLGALATGIVEGLHELIAWVHRT